MWKRQKYDLTQLHKQWLFPPAAACHGSSKVYRERGRKRQYIHFSPFSNLGRTQSWKSAFFSGSEQVKHVSGWLFFKSSSSLWSVSLRSDTQLNFTYIKVLIKIWIWPQTFNTFYWLCIYIYIFFQIYNSLIKHFCVLVKKKPITNLIWALFPL